MDVPALHSLEHLMAEKSNHLSNVRYWSMGCQTGFYLTVLNNESFDEIIDT